MSNSSHSKLVCRYLNGLPSQRIKPVDYDELRLEADEKRRNIAVSADRIKRLQGEIKFKKQQTDLGQHRLIWTKEYIRLNDLATRLENQISSSISFLTIPERDELIYLDSGEADEVREFSGNILPGVNSLRNELRYFTSQQSLAKKYASKCNGTSGDEILDKILVVKEDLLDMQDELNDLEADMSEHVDEERKNVLSMPEIFKIPEEVLDVSCPDIKLKELLLNEYVFVSGTFRSKLLQLQQDCITLEQTLYNNFCVEDTQKLQQIVESYQNSNISNWNRLLRHRLDMEFKSTLGSESLSLLESLTSKLKFNMDRQRCMKDDWKRTKTELKDKMLAALAESCEAFEKKRELESCAESQANVCMEWRKKLEVWREIKIEAMRLEDELQREKDARDLEVQARKREQEISARQRAKDGISAFRERKRSEQEATEQRKQAKLAELRRRMSDLAKKDKERVDFRKLALQEKETMTKVRLLDRAIDEKERELVLERLRETVRPTVEPDPVRATGYTSTWRNKLAKPDPSDMAGDRKSLFPLHTYNASQINKDPRLRIENELRQANLHDSEYARRLLSRIAPPTAQRRDQVSTFTFKPD